MSFFFAWKIKILISSVSICHIGGKGLKLHPEPLYQKKNF